MPTPLETLVQCGTKLWLDSVDPEFIQEYVQYGATGATSNPLIIAELIKSGRFDDQLHELMEQGLDDADIAWKLTDQLVRQAQDVFKAVYEMSKGDDGYVSFELDPLLEDEECPLSLDAKIQKYIELGKRWAKGHMNRMIKVPATQAGLAAVEELAAAGVTVNVTLIFTERQYRIARDNIWKGAQRRRTQAGLKSAYSIFISRIDVYTRREVPELSEAAQGQVGIVTAKRLWRLNQDFWADKRLPLKQEIIFASTGVKDPNDPPDKYVTALAGSDIMTNPPATNAAIQKIQKMEGKVFTRTVDQMPPQEILDEIDQKVDYPKMEDVLLREGIVKFAEPHKALLNLIAEKRSALAATG